MDLDQYTLCGLILDLDRAKCDRDPVAQVVAERKLREFVAIPIVCLHNRPSLTAPCVQCGKTVYDN